MRNIHLSHQTDVPLSRWQMPIQPETYRDRSPHLTGEEKELMELYVTAPPGFMTGGRARNVLHQLMRFETPFSDVVKLAPYSDVAIAAGRRHLFTYMVQTGLAFWAWPKETWVEVIQAAPGKKIAYGTRFWMLLLAYLFCGMLYVGPSTAYWPMAETIFGRDLTQSEVNKLRAQ